MSKWADYLISGVWKKTENENKYVSHVLLHKDSESSFSHGIKTSKDDVITLIKEGVSVVTIRWDYTSMAWVSGAKVEYVNMNGIEYLRSHKDAAITDNIDNLISMLAIG